MFQLAGDAAEAATARSQAVLEIETKLAENSVDRVTLRDPEKNYHILTKKELIAMAPNFGWESYFRAAGSPEFTSLNLGQPDFIKELSATLAAEPVDAWKTYLAYHVLREAAPRIGGPFRKRGF